MVYLSNMNLEVAEELKYRIVHKTKKPKISLRYFRDDTVYKITLQPFPHWNPDNARKSKVTQKFVWYVGISIQLGSLGRLWSQPGVIGWIKNWEFKAISMRRPLVDRSLPWSAYDCSIKILVEAISQVVKNCIHWKLSRNIYDVFRHAQGPKCWFTTGGGMNI